MDTKKKIVELDLKDILPNRFQPRLTFDEAGLIELTESIKAHGVIQPIIVRKLGDKFEIIAGERRYKASNLANLKTIPAIITDFNDKQSSEIALIENVQRRDLTPIEEAISYKRILDMNYMTQDELAKKLGKTQSTIANKLRLLNLTDDVQDALLENRISERHARSLLKIKNSNMQKEMLNRIINERLTVRRTDEEIDKMFRENENQEVNINNETQSVNENRFNMPTSGIIGDDNLSMSNSVDSGIDMLYNQATMNIPKIMGEDIQNYEEKNNNIQKPILNEPVEELSFGFQNQNNDFNPGFMNIADIENNAKDIFEEKPRKPFMFSEPDPVVQEEVNNDAKKEEVKPSFFNPQFLQPEPVATPEFEMPQEVDTQVSQSNDNPFEFDFVPAETVKTTEVAVPDLNDLEMFNFSSEQATPTEPVLEQPVVVPDPVVPLEMPEIAVDPVVEPNSAVSVQPASVEDTVDNEENKTPIIENIGSETEVLSFDNQTSTVVDPIVQNTENLDTLNVVNEPGTVEQTVVEPIAPVKNLTEPVTPEPEELEILDLSNDITEPTAVPVQENNQIVEPEPILESVVQEQPKEEKKGFFDRLKSLVDGNKEEKLDAPVVDPMINVSQPNEAVDIVESAPVASEQLSSIESTLRVETPEVIQSPEVLEPVVETLNFEENSPTQEIVEHDSGETVNNELIDIVDNVNFNNNVSETVNKDVLKIDDAEKIEEIPADILNSMNGDNQVLSTLDNIANDDSLDKTIDMPEALREIVSNPELTNNFVGNDDEQNVSVESVDETPLNGPENIEVNNGFTSPFETILDSVVLPEENNEVITNNLMTESSLDNTINNNESVVSEQPTVVNQAPIDVPNNEFEVFEPAKLPIEDDDEPAGEDLTVPLYSPIYEEDTPTVVPDTTPDSVVNMGSAMRVIRDAVDQLQKLGFIVDTEEFDFENMYQVIFKINKGNK